MSIFSGCESMADSKKQKKKTGRKRSEVSGKKFGISGTYILGIVVIVFMAVMLAQIYQLNQKKTAYDQREVELQAEYEEETERSQEIEALSEYMKTTQYIEDTAKSKLGLAYENEIIFKEKD